MKRTVAFIGGDPWEGIWARAQSLATAMAGLGHQVVYVNPPTFRLGLQTLRRLFRGPSLTREGGVLVFTPKCLPLPMMRAKLLRRLGLGFLYRLQEVWLERQLQRLGRSVGGSLSRSEGSGPSGVDAAIFNHPFHLHLARALAPNLLVYDNCDLFEAMPYVDQAEVTRAESACLQESDLVAVSSQDLYRRYQPRHRRTLLLQNGLDQRIFDLPTNPAPADLPDSPGPVIGFVGSLAAWIDVDLIAALADLRPAYQFVLVGPVLPGVDPSPLASRSNVHLLGRKPWADLPRYYSRFDLGLNPMRVSDLTHAVNPIKLFEYLAFGIPVVSTPLRELAFFAPLVASAPDAAGFAEQIDLLLAAETPDQRAERAAFARRNTWQERAARLAEEMTALLDGAENTCT